MKIEKPTNNRIVKRLSELKPGEVFSFNPDLNDIYLICKAHNNDDNLFTINIITNVLTPFSPNTTEDTYVYILSANVHIDFQYIKEK